MNRLLFRYALRLALSSERLLRFSRRLASTVGFIALLALPQVGKALSPEQQDEIARLSDADTISAYQQAVAEAFTSPEDLGVAYRLVGMRWESVYDRDRALEAFNQSVRILEQLPESAELVYSLGERSYILYSLTGDPVEFCPDRERALAIARRLGQPDPLVFALVRRAFCFQTPDNYQKGMEDLQEAMTIAQDSGLESSAQSMVANASGLLYRTMGLHDHAYSSFLQAYTLWREVDDVPDYFNMLHSLVGEAIEVGRWQDAARHVVSMFETAREYPKDNDYLFFSHFNQGRLALARTNYSLADSSLSSALLLADTTAEEHFVMQTYLHRAEARIWLGRYADARSDLKEIERYKTLKSDRLDRIVRLIQALESNDSNSVLAVMLQLRQEERNKRYAFVDANTRRFTHEHEVRIAQYESGMLKQKLDLQELQLQRAADKARLDQQGRTNLALVVALLLAVALWLYRSRRQHRHQAYTDHLTGIANRGRIFQHGFKLRDRAARRKQSLAVILFDIDRFKRINDRFGHGVGDDAIRQTVRAVQSTLHSGEKIGRLGGEEFIVILPGSDSRIALAHAEIMRAAVEKADFIHAGQHRIHCTISLGVAVLDEDENFQSLVNRADHALYVAKNSGRNTVTQAESEPVTGSPGEVGAGSRQEPRPEQ